MCIFLQNLVHLLLLPQKVEVLQAGPGQLMSSSGIQASSKMSRQLLFCAEMTCPVPGGEKE